MYKRPPKLHDELIKTCVFINQKYNLQNTFHILNRYMEAKLQIPKCSDTKCSFRELILCYQYNRKWQSEAPIINDYIHSFVKIDYGFH